MMASGGPAMIEWSKVVGWVLSGVLGLLFIVAGTAKLVAPEAFTTDMPPGIAAWIIVIGVGEVASAVLFLLPWTASLGTLLLSSFMGGAIIVHMTKQGTHPEESFIPQSVILI